MMRPSSPKASSSSLRLALRFPPYPELKSAFHEAPSFSFITIEIMNSIENLSTLLAGESQGKETPFSKGRTAAG